MSASKITAAIVSTLILATACFASSPLRMLSNDGEYIEYAGLISLSGIFYSDPTNLEIQDLVCFLPDSSSQRRLPQHSEVNPLHWMCFSNSEEAGNMLGLSSDINSDSACYKGFATIIIRNYSRFISESEGVSFTQLVSVSNHEAALAVPCHEVHQFESMIRLDG